jgi:hypothetical protein
MIRVGFFAAFPFHAPILAPVRDALAGAVDTLLSEDRRAIVTFSPHVVVMAAVAHLEYFRAKLPEAFIINVRHGLISKQGLRRLPGRASVRRFDAVCVGDEHTIASYQGAGAGPGAFWETGYPQLDPLFRCPAPRFSAPPPLDASAGREPAGPGAAGARPRPGVQETRLPGPTRGARAAAAGSGTRLDPARPTVLYAPTWNLGLTSAAMIGDRLVELVRAQAPGVNILIKPHPVIGDWRPRWMACWARLAAAHSGVRLVADTHVDLVPYLLTSDVLISDASSAIFAFLALDRPIILVTNPRHTADPAWAPGDIVWTWRDVGDEIYDVRDLPGAVAMALRDPSARRERRRAYARTLFGPFTDGRSAQRVAERILDAGARVARGEHRPAARPPRTAWLWHDVRTRLREHAVVRRLVLCPLEGIRLGARARGQARVSREPLR